jgi:hypothetical protein
VAREQLQPRPSVELFSAPAVVRAEEAVGSGAAKDEEMMDFGLRRQPAASVGGGDRWHGFSFF